MVPLTDCTWKMSVGLQGLVRSERIIKEARHIFIRWLLPWCPRRRLYFWAVIKLRMEDIYNEYLYLCHTVYEGGSRALLEHKINHMHILSFQFFLDGLCVCACACVCTSATLSSNGSSQWSLHSQWESKKVRTGAVAASAPRTLERISPEGNTGYKTQKCTQL